MRTGSNGMQVMETPAEMLTGLAVAAEARQDITIAGVHYVAVVELAERFAAKGMALTANKILVEVGLEQRLW